MHAVLALVPRARRRAACRTESPPTPSRARRGDGADGSIEARLRRHRDACGSAGDGLGLRIADAAAGLTPVHRDVPVHRAGRRRPPSSPRTRPGAATGSPRSRATLVVEGDGALGAAHALVRRRRRRRRGRSRSRNSRRRGAPTRVRATFDDVVARGRATSSATTSTHIAPWRDAPHARRRARRLRAVVGDRARRCGFLRRESMLMSKHWMDKVWSWDHCFNALALAPGLPGERARPVPRAVRPPGRGRRASRTRSPTPRCSYNFVKPPIHGWALARAARARSARRSTATSSSEVYDRLARWTRFWLDHRRVAGSRPARTTSTATTAAGTTRRRSTATASSSRPTSRRSWWCSSTCWSRLADELGPRRPRAGASRARRDPRRALLDQLWDGERLRRASARRRGSRARRRACSTCCRSSPRDRLPAEVRERLADEHPRRT